MIKKLYIFVLALVLIGCSQKPAQVIFNDTLAGYTDRIIVDDSENIYTIASKYNVSMPALILANNIKFPFILKEGQTLVLPYPDQYKVKKDDSIYKIAKQFNLNVSQLIAMNDLKSPYGLTEGQELRLPPAIKKGEGTKTLVYVKPVLKDNTEAETIKVLSEEQNISFIPVPVMKDSQRVSGHSISESPSPSAVMSKTLQKKQKNEGFIWPVEGRLLSGFGPKTGGLYNDGINIRVKEGVHVKASASGRVVYSDGDLEGYGNLVIIKHSNGYITAYAHNRDLLVKQGDFVEQGEDIAVAGSTGNVRVSQLHFGIRKGKKPVNPVRYLKPTRS